MKKDAKTFCRYDVLVSFLIYPASFSIKVSMSYHSDVVIGRTDLLCGEKLYDRGLQRLEAMLYAVDR